jgi:hypothetical protein
VHFCSTRHKPDFGGKSEAGKSEAILSARQHQPEGQNPIALPASKKNAAQAWLRQSRSENVDTGFSKRSCSSKNLERRDSV